jgi:hypothetical protein
MSAKRPTDKTASGAMPPYLLSFARAYRANLIVAWARASRQRLVYIALIVGCRFEPLYIVVLRTKSAAPTAAAQAAKQIVTPAPRAFPRKAAVSVSERPLFFGFSMIEIASHSLASFAGNPATRQSAATFSGLIGRRPFFMAFKVWASMPNSSAKARSVCTFSRAMSISERSLFT